MMNLSSISAVRASRRGLNTSTGALESGPSCCWESRRCEALIDPSASFKGRGAAFRFFGSWVEVLVFFWPFGAGCFPLPVLVTAAFVRPLDEGPVPGIVE